MSAEANPQLALRPMLPGEGPLLAEIFRASIMELTGDEYEIEQQEAWAAAAEDEAAFAERLAGHTTIVATMSRSPVGFASLEADDKIGFLYVHPAVVERGVGTLLADALEKIAGGRGANDLSINASIAKNPGNSGVATAASTTSTSTNEKRGSELAKPT